MSHDFYHNRIALGSIPQLDVEVPIFELTKNLHFTATTDLTDNFTQFLGSGATQTVTSSVVQFRNSSYDKDNHIESKFLMKFLNEVEFYFNHWASNTSYWWSPNFGVDIVDANGTVVANISINNCISYTYSESAWVYWNSGYLYWQLSTDANTQAVAVSRRLITAVGSGYHTWKLVDNKNGTVNIYVDGSIVGTNLSLGNSSYRLGYRYWLSPLGGWYNNAKYGDLDYCNFKYNN